MNKQEAIKRLKEQLIFDSDTTIRSEFGEGCTFCAEYAIAIVGELDEPEKPVVPKFVADWIEKSRSLNSELYEAIYVKDEDAKSDWIMDNSEIFAKAWMYGYEVEKEKLYKARNKLTNGYLFKIHDVWSDTFRFKKENGEALTKEIWEELGVWDNKVYEMEEVEE